jgi:CheY-like chemotaxis protein
MTQLNGVSILVVEDDPDARELMHAVFEQRGAQVRSADGVARAFELLADGLPDIIVSDIAMPEEDGVAFLRRLREMPAPLGGRIPAVAVSAFTANSDRTRALEAGFDRYLIKPVDFEQLCLTIQSLVDRHDKVSA